LDGQTILHTACRENLEKLVKFLHTCGANPNLRDNDEQTPLLLAAERGHTSICEILTEKFKANVNMRAKVISISDDSDQDRMSMVNYSL